MGISLKYFVSVGMNFLLRPSLNMQYYTNKEIEILNFQQQTGWCWPEPAVCDSFGKVTTEGGSGTLAVYVLHI